MSYKNIENKRECWRRWSKTLNAKEYLKNQSRLYRQTEQYKKWVKDYFSRKEILKNKKEKSNLLFYKKFGYAPLPKSSKELKIKLSNSKKEYYKLHPETINKIKLARAKQILPVKNTTIEVKVQNFLKQLGIEFLTHHRMNINHSYQCDIYIPLMNIVIECDGTYWHSYPTGNEIDHIRTKELLEKGFKVLRLWEFEIREMDINKFKNKLIKEVNNNASSH